MPPPSSPPSHPPAPATGDAGPDRSYGSRSGEALARLMRVGALAQLRCARTLKHYGLSPATCDILAVLHDTDEPLPSRQIARRITTAVPDVTRLIDRLAGLGLVSRQPSPRDKRVVLIQITPEGRDRVKKARVPLDSMAKQVVGRLKKSERKELIRLLTKLDAPLTDHV